MAKNFNDIHNSVFTTGNKMDFTNAMIRSNGIPLDYYSVFNSYNNAVIYAAKNPVAYEGQVIAVTENDDTVVYVITPTSQGTVTIDGSAVNVYIKEVGKAELDWSKITNKPTTISDYGITDAYTKTEIDTKVSSVYRYKGTIDSYENLPTSGMTVGDVYNIETAYPGIMWKVVPVSSISLMFDNEYVVLFNVTEYPLAYSGNIIDFYDSDMNLLCSVSSTDIGLENQFTVVFTDSEFSNKAVYIQIHDQATEESSVGETVYTGRSIRAGDNVAWDGTDWDVLAGTIDLSIYAEKATSLAGYGITDAYTKTEIDSKVSSVCRYRGSVDAYIDLPKSGMVVGDVYNIRTKSTGSVTWKLIPITNVSLTSISDYDNAISGSYDNSTYTDSSLQYLDGHINFYDSNLNLIETGYTSAWSPRNGYFDYVMVNDRTPDVSKIVYMQRAGHESDFSIAIGKNVTKYVTFNAGDNVVWSGSVWDVFSGTVDLSGYAEKATTLSGYGITDAYTKTEVDNAFKLIDTSAEQDKTLRIVAVSDLHFDSADTELTMGLDNTRFQTMVSSINAEHHKKPIDFCVLNGDLITLNTSDDKENRMKELIGVYLNQLEMPWFAIRGNHDCYSNADWEEMFQQKTQVSIETESFLFLLIDVYSDYEYNSLIGGTELKYMGVYLQLDWIREQVSYAKAANKKVICFYHYVDFTKTASDGTSLLEADWLDYIKSEDAIVATVVGHSHDVYAQIDSITTKPKIGTGNFGSIPSQESDTTHNKANRCGYKIIEAKPDKLAAYHIYPRLTYPNWDGEEYVSEAEQTSDFKILDIIKNGGADYNLTKLKPSTNSLSGLCLCGGTASGLSSAYNQYIWLDYIESTGSQYINTYFEPNQNTRVVCDFQYTVTPTAHWGVFGSRSSAQPTGNTYTFGYTQGAFRTDYYRTRLSYNSTIDALKRHIVDKNKNITTLDGTIVTHDPVNYRTGFSIALFSINTNNVVDNFSHMRMYSCKIYDNEILVRDYAPCINPYGVVGMYDKVGKQFFYSMGTESFIAGYKG